MSTNKGLLVIAPDTVLRGKIRNGTDVEIHGYVEGHIVSENIVVHQGGQFFGQVNAGNADVNGNLQGDVFVRKLFRVGQTGVVNGNIQYGQLAMAAGGSLSADVRNVPPTIGGDLDVTVYKGRSVTITVMDLTAVDPDDAAVDLIYSVSNARNGVIAHSNAPGSAVKSFSQADLEAGKVQFRHDGSDAPAASFDVIVTDHAGATSGAPMTVKVNVHAER